MADSDLADIPGLRPKHLAVLADQCQITTPGALARADRRIIHAAMRRLRPRPGLEEIAAWQDHARDLSLDIELHPGWDQVAAFVVSFEQRGPDESPERRLVAEQAERGSPVPRSVWPGWSCDAICGWMHEQFTGEAGAQSAPTPTPASESASTAASDQATKVRRGAARAERRQIAVDRLTLLDADGTTTDLDPAAGGRTGVECNPGSRLRVTVGGVPVSAEVHLALRVRRPGRPGWTPHGPTTSRPGKPVEIDLSELREGSHTMVLTAWTSQATAAPSVVPLPTISVRAATG
jgi:hypothetical protein